MLQNQPSPSRRRSSGTQSPHVRVMDHDSDAWRRFSKRRYGRHHGTWMPQGSSRLARFYLNRLHEPHSFSGLAAGHAAKSFCGFSALRSRLLSLESTSRLSNLLDDDLQESLHELFETRGIREKHVKALLALENPDELDQAMSVLFLFGSKKTPFAVAKVAGKGCPEAYLMEREHKVITSLRKHARSSLQPLLPPDPKIFRSGSHTMFLQPFIEGRPLSVQLRNSWNPRALASRQFSMAADWLSTFHRASTQGRSALGGDLAGEYIANILKGLRGVTSLSDRERQMLDHLSHLAWDLRSEEVPIVGCHGNFWARNIFEDEGEVRVLGWSDFRDRRLPFRDLLLFAISYGLIYPWKRGNRVYPVPAFSASLLERTWLSERIRDFLRGYCRVMGLEERLLDLFLPLFLAEQVIVERGLARNHEAQTWRSLFREYAERGGFVWFKS